MLFCFTLMNRIYCRAENVVVVIDPGHGGENLGGQTDEYIEQELTLKVAQYMKERLEQYEGVDVYLTHSEIGSKDLTRDERAEIAAEYNADFLFSLHFNMSENHTLYGSEVWTSAFGEYYVKGQEFAAIEMEGLHGQLGFFDRGIKTRLGKTGDDYYGIILNCKKKNIPAVIIEHCHLDESRDNYFLKENDNPYQVFGYTDADSVAKYFHLSSASLGLDYSDYQYNEVALPADKVAPDKSEPEYCSIELVSSDTKEGIAKVSVSSYDPDCRMQYYQYSKDGGNTYSILYPWNSNSEASEAVSENVIEIEIPLDVAKEGQLTVRAYNRFDLYADSGIINLPAAEEIVELSEEANYDDYELITYEVKPDKKPISIKEIKEIAKVPDEMLLYIVGGVFILTLLISAFLVLTIINAGKKRRRRRRRKRGPY